MPTTSKRLSYWPRRTALRTASIFVISTMPQAAAIEVTTLAPPVVDGKWLVPAPLAPAQPIWGHAEGLRVGIHPLAGPRGLLRVYAPYLNQPDGRVINFIAIEPIPRGSNVRGFSELEFSVNDNEQGKRLWSARSPLDHAPQPPDHPVQGEVEAIDGVDHLRVYIMAEPFANGAHVYLRLTFRADRPHEVGIAGYVHKDSIALSHCIITATMGNYARLRRLHLADSVATADALWPAFQGRAFTDHATFPLASLARTPEGDAVVWATPDETHPESVDYAPGTNRHWHYTGNVAQQGWRVAAPDPNTEVRVNGRRVYWNSDAPIPGGISFENFEMVAPFRQGDEFWFAVENRSSTEITR